MAAASTGGTPATVLFTYNSSDKGQLSLLPGETIWVLDKLGGGWWKGRNEDGDVGFFPGSYVREAPTGSGSSSPVPAARDASNPNGATAVATALVNSGSSTNLKKAATVSRPSLKKAIAQFKYEAKSASELSFDIGDEVLVFPVKDGESAGWWTGALASAPNVVAHFPASYVKLTGGLVDDSIQRSKDDKANKRKSQPASRGTSSSTTAISPTSSTVSSSSSSSSSKSKPPTSRPPARPGDATPDSDGMQDGVVASPRSDSMAPLRPSNGLNGSGPVSAATAVDTDSLSRATEQATKLSEQTKQGLIKLQQQSKHVFEGMMQRLDAADKDRARLENAMREMHKMLQTSEAARTKLAQQNQVLYQQLTELKTQLSMEASARSSMEARLAKLEQGR